MELSKDDPLANPEEKPVNTRVCAYCKQPYQTKVGIQNWKNLFRKPTLDDLITLVIIVLVIASYYAYMADTKVCRETVANIKDICAQYYSGIVNNGAFDYNLSSLAGYNLSINYSSPNKCDPYCSEEYYANHFRIPNITFIHENNSNNNS